MNKLIEWYRINKRDLPWRDTRDPYKVWLSEIILQQTRVAQGLPYYLKFVEQYPSVTDLAQASEQEVLKLWQGLGYYSRARNLHYTARDIVENYEGRFPATYRELLKLKGVGEYTAAAIASFCYDEPVAVIDGNVFRVLARLHGIDTPVNTTEGKKIFKHQAAESLDKRQPGVYNQAIMEFGALQCVPGQPDCEICPLQAQCTAYKTGKVRELPVKLPKVKIKKRFLHYIIVRHGNRILWQKRTDKDIWKNLYQPVLIEGENAEDIPGDKLRELYAEYKVQPEGEPQLLYKTIHQLTHRRLEIVFWEVYSKHPLHGAIATDELKKYPVPVVIAKFLDNYNL